MRFGWIIMSFVFLGLHAQERELVFEENFDGPVLDESIWNFELGDGCPGLCGWGNNERQLYTRNNIAFEDGNLIITARLDKGKYTSSRITTKGKVEVQYGSIEVRAKVPSGHGLWPAIWMLGHDIDTNTWPGCGEIDIMEYVGREPGTIYTSVHTPSGYGDNANTQKTGIERVEEGFHVYRADWTAERVVFHIDDRPVYTYSPEVKTKETWPLDKPFYLLLNMAIGGNFGGPEVDDTIFPADFAIDYIRIYKPV
jgi:beta-glucanase (GH16 family)